MPSDTATTAAAEPAEAAALWRPLAAFPYAEQLQAVEADPALRSPDLCRHLHRRSEQVASGDARTASQLANLALRITAHLADRCQLAQASDLRALGHAYLGNARRCLGELHGAGDAYDAARRWRLAHMLGPILVAAFANSPWQAGRPTGLRAALPIRLPLDSGSR